VPPQAILVFDWSISKKSSPLKPMNNVYREPSIDANDQVSVHLVKLFQKEKIKM
jgi:hypothetical protein